MKLFSAGSILFYLMYFTFPQSAGGQTILIQGEISGVLVADTVRVTGNVHVPAGQTLTFLPGTEVITSGFFGFNISGTVLALGNSTEAIRFSVSDTSGFYNQADGRGGWNGFHFINTDHAADSSKFFHCTFEFGKAFGDSLDKMGGIFNIRDYSKIMISDCEFNHNSAVFWGGAIFAENSNLIIRNTVFSGNFCGTPGPPYGYGGAVCLRYSKADILGCKFFENSSTGIGGAVSFEYSDVLLQTGIFLDNFSALGGALGYLRSTPLRPVAGNLFTGNSSLFFGGAVSCNKANPRFINNTIAGNSSVSYGGGFYCNDSAVPLLINTIIYDNYAPEGQQVYIWDVNSAPEFYHCNVQGGSALFGGTGGVGFSAPYINNLDTIPEFHDTQPHPYSISDISPCINSGDPDTTGLFVSATDLAGNKRLVGKAIDIGAYENQSGINGIRKTESGFSIVCYPNPFREQVTFILPHFSHETCSIRITDLQGLVVFSSSGISRSSFTWKCRSNQSSILKSGTYICTVTIGLRQSTSTITCIR
ncbi:MAG: choice-of-anchor Q domain-containing protein [Bacteroidota bacterium]